MIDFSHHAYLIEGGDRKKLLQNLKKSGSPDFFEIEEENLSIRSAKKISDFQSKKSLKDKKIIFISINRATREAQNALLKTLEEPTPNTFFVIIAPRRDIFLPTVQSRLEIIEEKKKDNQKEFESFSKLSLKKRLEMVDQIVKEKDKIRAENLIESILNNLNRGKNANYLNRVLELKKYLKDRSPNLKQILEYTVVNFPE